MGFGTPVPLLVGIILILLGVGLFFLDNFKPGYKRDSDTVYSILFLTVGILALLIWSAGFVEALQLMVSAGTLIALMIERLQSRNPNRDLGRPSDNGGPYRDDPRPSRPSRYTRNSSYDDMPRSDVRAEIDNEFIPSSDDFSNVRRIRGSRDSRGNSGRDPYAQDTYQQDPYQPDTFADQLSEDNRGFKRTSRRSSNANENEVPFGETRSRRRPLQLGDEGSEGQGFSNDFSAAEPVTSRRRNRSSASSEAEGLNNTRSNNKRRRPRPNLDRPSDGEYVDYKPLDTPNQYPGDGDEFDNSNNFDDDPQFK